MCKKEWFLERKFRYVFKNLEKNGFNFVKDHIHFMIKKNGF